MSQLKLLTMLCSKPSLPSHPISRNGFCDLSAPRKHECCIALGRNLGCAAPSASPDEVPPRFRLLCHTFAYCSLHPQATCLDICEGGTKLPVFFWMATAQQRRCLASYLQLVVTRHGFYTAFWSSALLRLLRNACSEGLVI